MPSKSPRRLSPRRLSPRRLSPRRLSPPSLPSNRKLYTLYKSTNSLKKFDIWIELPNGKVKKVSFGGAGYEDYTTHKDIERRKRYRIRHKNDKIHDPTKPGFWAYWILWGETTDKKKNLKNILKNL
jgi:hypothetical protein